MTAYKDFKTRHPRTFAGCQIDEAIIEIAQARSNRLAARSVSDTIDLSTLTDTGRDISQPWIVIAEKTDMFQVSKVVTIPTIWSCLWLDGTQYS